MPKPLFVDTGYVIALINESDRHHPQSVQLAKKYAGVMVLPNVKTAKE